MHPAKSWRKAVQAATGVPEVRMFAVAGLVVLQQ
jgi:hypothetical protein